MRSIPWPKGEKVLRAVVSGGGTGGHIYPALAIAAALKEQLGAEILYMGAKANTHGGPAKEKELAENAGWTFAAVSASGLSRRSLRMVRDLYVNYRGIAEAKEVLRRFAPQVAIGTGGYAMVPVLRAAVSLGVPTMIHEQNAYPGWANRYLARYADAVCLSFEGARGYFPATAPTVLTGLPVRQEILTVSREAAAKFWGFAAAERERKTLLLTGGSQGAQRLNEALCGCYGQLLDAGLRIIHLTGEAHYQKCREAAAGLRQENLYILPYLKEMQYALSIADLVVARSGASFLAEAAVVGLPAILIPYPYAAHDEQTLNARVFTQAGAARMIENQRLDSQTLAEQALELLGNATTLQAMAKAAKGLAMPDAIEDIVKVVAGLIRPH